MLDTAVKYLSDVRLLFYYVKPSEFVPYGHDLTKVPPYTLRAIVPFFLMFALESLVGYFRKTKIYRMNDFICSLMSGAVMLIVQSFTKVFALNVYIRVYENYRVVDLRADSWSVWIGLFLLIDFGYYWMHRFAHTYHILWSAHSVHHSGQDYNLATALRQGALQGCYSWIFYIECALFFPPGCYLAHSALNTLGQFWIHTKTIGSCGPLEYILNTPSHHRMHHRPPGNCNYGALLIIWDRMFGTFKAEKAQKEHYGLAEPLNTFDPLWANIEHLHRVVVKGNGFSHLFKRRAHHAWVFKPLEVFAPLPKPDQPLHIMSSPEDNNPINVKHNPETSNYVSFYCFINFVVNMVWLLTLLLFEREFHRAESIIHAACLIASFSILGRILDLEGNDRNYIDKKMVYGETLRLVILCMLWNYSIQEHTALKNPSTLFLPIPLLFLWVWVTNPVVRSWNEQAVENKNK